MKYVFILFLFLTACSRREDYDLDISDSFTEPQVQIIIQAIETWENICNIYVQVSVDEVTPYSVSAIYPGINGGTKSGLHYPFINRIPIFLETIESNKEFYITVLHELGHWIGGIHTSNEQDVMYFAINDNQTKITQEDIQSVCPWR